MNHRSSQQSMLQKLLSTFTGAFPVRTQHHSHGPTRHDPDAWCLHWESLGQPWRTEPEIETKRQQELAQRRAIQPDPIQKIYPFKEMKLSRADVEWLLATHEDGRGPIDWNDRSQREREGLDLRGADLRGVNLKDLPLARFQGGFIVWGKWAHATDEQHEAGAIHLEGANLRSAHIEGAILERAHLEEAELSWSHAEDAEFSLAHLQGALFQGANLKNADFAESILEGADFRWAILDEASLSNAHLEGALLSNAFFDRATRLNNIFLSNKERGSAFLADIHWGDANLTVVEWSQLDILGDEQQAQQKRQNGQRKTIATRLNEYEAAVRANRQVAVVLQGQGLDEDAARFAYRGKVLQRRVWGYRIIQHNIKFKQRGQALSAWLFSWFLFLLAGYGYRLWRSFFAYLLIIGFFMTMYHALGPHLAWGEAFVVSMTAFHGRGISPNAFAPGDPLSFVSASEALVGLIIEVTFIATLTRRLFGQ